MRCPAKKDTTGNINHSDKDRGIYVRRITLGVQMRDCHIIVDVKRALRPKRRYKTVGEALMKASTIGFERPNVSVFSLFQVPLGLIAGARAINKSTFSFSCG
jgi:hypothetical protein